jgi:hypothetical protein
LIAVAAPPVTSHGQMIDRQRDRLLQRVEPDQRVADDDRQRREQHHAHRRAEVTAVHRRQRHQRDRPALGVLTAGARDQPFAQPTLRDQRGCGQQDQVRHDRLERRLAGVKQQQAAGDPGSRGDRQHPREAPALAHQIAPLREGCADEARRQRNRVCHVRHHGRQPGGDQGGERDQAATARDRIDCTSGERGSRREFEPGQIAHPRSDART